jgi:sigma-B regulation protein RsbU (phosphoserine phosphatase)
MISQGNFETRLPIEQSEIGKLFAYINNTAEQLRSYVATATQHAITESQLAEAKRLQSDFLVKKLPQLKEISLDAYFQPAYEIGADWYDAFRVDDILFLVVADVCDKGIPSALYMSVFRSLLRNNLTNYCAILDSASEIISESIAAVNRYMAENHGVSCMFATIFMAAYTIRDRTLSYIIAGHETPLLMHGSRIEILTLGGPAVGLFADARFSSGHIDIEPGSVLLAYSDGLPDTRNQEGERFGTDRIRNILREHSSEDWSSSRLISRLRESVLEFQGNSEQFDDLTLFAIRVTDTIEEDKFRD